MSHYLYVYGKVGLGVAATLLTSNMLSIFIPGNQRVDPKYEWSQQDWDRAGDCLVISSTKAVIGGLGWPLLGLRLVGDLAISPSNACNVFNVGYKSSPHYLSVKTKRN